MKEILDKLNFIKIKTFNSAKDNFKGIRQKHRKIHSSQLPILELF